MALIVTATLLPFGAMASSQLPPRWCVACGGLWLTDAVSNVVLFLPFGAAIALRRWPWWQSALAAFTLSLLVEWLQSMGWPPARSAAWADVITNTTGGVGGWAVVHFRHMALTPSPMMARRLTIVWAVLSATLFWLTGVALSPVSADSDGTSAPALVASSYRHVPGQPFFGAPVDSAIVDGRYRVRRGWPGPVIVEAAHAAPSLTADVYVRGRERERFTVPIVFVHLPADSSPLLQISSRGDAAQLTVTRQAWRWGLAFPVLTLPTAFANRAADDPRPLQLSARATLDSVQLRASTRTTTESAALALDATLGWALLQTVVGAQSSAGPMVAWAWLLFLLAPVGWWAMRAGAAAWRTSIAACVLIASALVATSAVLHGATISPGAWATIVVSVALGAVAAWGTQRRRAPTIQ